MVSFSANKDYSYQVGKIFKKIKVEWLISAMIIIFGFGLTISAAAVSASSTKITYIASVEDLEKVRENLDGYFKVTAQELILREDWEPIGTEEHPFTGTFEGDNATVIGLGFKSMGDEDNNYCGFFGCNEGTVIHLNFWIYQDEIVSYSGEKDFYTGVVAGINKGKITSCEIQGYGFNVETQNDLYAGSLAGANYGDLRNNYIRAAIAATSSNGNAYVGGLTGVTYDGSVIELNETRNSDWITSTADNGISSSSAGIGIAKGGSLRDCYLTSTVSGSGQSFRGGAIAGTIDADTSFSVEDCYAPSNITVYRNTGDMGGLMGVIEEGSVVSLKDSLYGGSISANTPFTGSFGELVAVGDIEPINSFYLKTASLSGTHNIKGSLIDKSDLSLEQMDWNGEYWAIENGTITFTRRNSE